MLFVCLVMVLVFSWLLLGHNRTSSQIGVTVGVNRRPYHPKAPPWDGRGHMSQGAICRINHDSDTIIFIHNHQHH